MGSRWILFGYKMEYCKYIVVQEEAKTVKRIFNSYIDGMTLKAIADDLTAEQIQYKEGRTTWNKNMIARIIENAHYAGDSDYPQIVSRDMFEAALKRKNTLGGKREKDTAEIKYLKSILFCATCGGRIRRVAKYTATRERWLCENNCKSNRYFDDSTLFSEIQNILNAVILNPALLDTNSTKSTYEPNIETIRKEKEIRYMLDQPNIQFNPIKKAVLDCTQSKFDCCAFDSSVYTEPLKKYMKTQKPTGRLNIELLALTAGSIYINSNGSVTIRFINGKEICSTERNGAENAGSKNSN